MEPVVSNQQQPLHLSPYLDIIHRHRRVSVCVVAVGIATTIFLVALLPNQYKSSATIMIEAPQVAPAYVNMSSASASSKDQPANVADQLEAIAHTAFTQPRLEELINKYGLYHRRSGQATQSIVNYMRK